MPLNEAQFSSSPLFYLEGLAIKQEPANEFAPVKSITTDIILSEANSRHAVQVLRMQNGDVLYATDGRGQLLQCHITEAHKKNCKVQVSSTSYMHPKQPTITIAISLVKNANRFEWFLEKATELGVQNIIPLICERTEKERYKQERMHNILVSAMLQSKQLWLPQLSAPITYKAVITDNTVTNIANKYIAHCIQGNKEKLTVAEVPSVILIGPEGDFTPSEIELALQAGYKPVTLGNTRLRTETAGVVAAALLKI